MDNIEDNFPGLRAADRLIWLSFRSLLSERPFVTGLARAIVDRHPIKKLERRVDPCVARGVHGILLYCGNVYIAHMGRSITDSTTENCNSLYPFSSVTLAVHTTKFWSFAYFLEALCSI